MQTIAHPATGSDLRNVARIIGQIYGTADSGQALLGQFGEPAPAYLASADPAGAPQSPLAGDCSGLPPLLIACGDAEVLRDDAVRFAHRAAAAGVPVDLEIFEGMPHGFPALSLDASERLLTRIATFTAAATFTTPLR